MVEQLAEDELLGQWFDGHRGRVRCFLHILNLVAKSLICQFDADADKEKTDRDAASRQLETLARELEEWESAAATAASGSGSKAGVQRGKGKNQAKGKAKGKGANGGDSAAVELDAEDDPDDEIDAMTLLTAEQRAKIEAGMRPIKLVIAKVSVRTCEVRNDGYSRWDVLR